MVDLLKGDVHLRGKADEWGHYGYEAGCRSSILLRIDAKFLHSSKERRAVHSEAGCSAIGTTDASLACRERSNNVIALPSIILVNNTGFVDWGICFFFNERLESTMPGA